MVCVAPNPRSGLPVPPANVRLQPRSVDRCADVTQTSVRRLSADPPLLCTSLAVVTVRGHRCRLSLRMGRRRDPGPQPELPAASKVLLWKNLLAIPLFQRIPLKSTHMFLVGLYRSHPPTTFCTVFCVWIFASSCSRVVAQTLPTRCQTHERQRAVPTLLGLKLHRGLRRGPWGGLPGG